MKNKRKSEGITLIALVITIVILLILAGVTITNLTTENGIIKKAKTSKELTELAGLEEQVEMAIIKANQKHRNANIYNIIEELKNSKIISNEEQVDIETGKIETDLGYIIEGKLDEYVIKEAIPGKIVTGEKNKEYTKNGKAIIPVGFMIVPGLNDISEGLVISDNVEDTELDINNKVAKGNQFVWIPVADENAYKRNVNYASIDNSKNAYTTHEDYLPNEIQEKIQEELDKAEATEDKTIEQVKGQINENAEREQVVSKGGFYISRYEAGKKNNAAISQKGEKVYNYVSFGTAKEDSKKFINNNYVKSAIISGIQWDMTMEFISSKPRIDGTGKSYDVLTYDIRRHKGGSVGLEVTGNNEADKVCNIYDLEGSCLEHIAERNTVYNIYPNNVRGGNLSDSGVTCREASYRGHHINGMFEHLSFRFVLYVM